MSIIKEKKMSTKGTKLSSATRHKISLVKTKHTKTDLLKTATEYISYLQDNEKQLPTLSGYCLRAGIHPTNLRDYTIKFPEVCQLVETIALMQEQYCLTRGITNRANPIFSMFLLKSKHEFKDQPQKLEQNNTFNISPDLLADALDLMKSKKKK